MFGNKSFSLNLIMRRLLIKRNLLLAVFTSLTVALTAGSASAQGYLSAKGRIIVNGKGEKVILRGMGLGGWMLQEGYMFHLSNLGQQHRIREAIESVIGPEKTANFYQKWLTYHTTRADIDSMAKWGFNSVRLPMHYALYTLPVDQEPVAGKNTWIEKGFALTDSLLKWCKANKMYLILDLHATPGGQGNDLPISDRYADKPSLWQSEANQQKMIALWHKLAQRYANEPYIGGYDIINEPNWGFENATDKIGNQETKNEPLKKLMMDVTKSIREVDKKHIIIIEGNAFGNNYNGLLPTWDNNMVLSFHKYGNFNTQQAIQHFLDLSDRYNVPLWMGESGENSNTWFTEEIGLVESHNIGWSWWQLKKMGINNPLEIKEPKNYQLLLDYWSGKGPKPTEAQSEAILNELLENLKVKNNIWHKDVTDAMFRQVSTTETKPFKVHKLINKLTINAVDYDLGRQRYAYMDRDTASYIYTPGVHTQGNRGHAYRNDGVDIQRDSLGYHIFSIEDGEWLQYTINVKKAGIYKIRFNVSSTNGEGKITTVIGAASPAATVNVPATGSDHNWKMTDAENIRLRAGNNKLRIIADKGDFTLKSIELSN
jgi:aryl-phospho-beta-D-glucosidase BglC (GH1 family)